MTIGKQLKKLKRIQTGIRPVRKIPLPTVSDVLYAPPNPGDMEPKACGNCCMFVPNSNQCLIVDGNLEADMVCGYHVPGKPRDTWEDMGQELVSQELAGVEFNPTSCGSCKFSYNENNKLYCEAVTDQGKPALIELFGCCTRWTS